MCIYIYISISLKPTHIYFHKNLVTISYYIPQDPVNLFIFPTCSLWNSIRDVAHPALPQAPLHLGQARRHRVCVKVRSQMPWREVRKIRDSGPGNKPKQSCMICMCKYIYIYTYTYTYIYIYIWL